MTVKYDYNKKINILNKWVKKRVLKKWNEFYSSDLRGKQYCARCYVNLAIHSFLYYLTFMRDEYYARYEWSTEALTRSFRYTPLGWQKNLCCGPALSKCDSICKTGITNEPSAE